MFEEINGRRHQQATSIVTSNEYNLLLTTEWLTNSLRSWPCLKRSMAVVINRQQVLSQKLNPKSASNCNYSYCLKGARTTK